MKDLKCLVDFITPVLEYYDKQGYEIIFVSGGCKKGGDRFAEIIADQFGITKIIHYPDKSKLPDEPLTKDFTKINFERNTLIARDSDKLFALVAHDRTGGTEDTIRKFKRFYPKGELYIL